jgi:hypothetical protein
MVFNIVLFYVAFLGNINIEYSFILWILFFDRITTFFKTKERRDKKKKNKNGVRGGEGFQTLGL